MRPLRVRVAVLLGVLVLSSAFASLARADAYAWGGHLGRVSVSVSLSGFVDGAGTDGWRLENARWFATWAARFGRAVPPEPAAAPLYTVQVLAAARPEHADALARRIDRSLSGGSDDFFFEACLPCATRTAHVLEPDARGIRRVVVGVYADRAPTLRRSWRRA